MTKETPKIPAIEAQSHQQREWKPVTLEIKHWVKSMKVKLLIMMKESLKAKFHQRQWKTVTLKIKLVNFAHKMKLLKMTEENSKNPCNRGKITNKENRSQ